MFNKEKYPAIFSDPAVRTNPIFSGFKKGHYAEAAEYFREESHEYDEKFTLTDGENTRFIIIKTGSLEISEIIKNDWGTEVNTLTGSQSAGDINLLQPDFSQLMCRVIEPVELISLSRSNFEKMQIKKTRYTNLLYLNLCNIICDRLARLNDEYLQLYMHVLASNKGNLKRRKNDLHSL